MAAVSLAVVSVSTYRLTRMKGHSIPVSIRIIFLLYQIAFLVIKLPNAYAFALRIFALVVWHSVLVVDYVGSLFLPVDKVGLHLYIAVGEIEVDLTLTHIFAEAFGAADRVVAVELDYVLVVAGVERYGAGGAVQTHAGDRYRV